ncbi:MAG: hypothetical protein IJS47_06725, partial [Clostridia bacterium]|nr:hypothetical protein [Clostridia bacterium]
RRKKEILEIIGAKEEDFGTIVNKIPNILTNLNLANRVKAIEENLQISTKVLNPNRNSEMYRYLVNKPDLILSGKVMDILLDYAKLVNVDKRLLKKGIAITTIIDNLEVGIEILNNADLNVPDNVRKRIIEKFINNSNGKLAREAYKMLKGRVRAHEKGLTPEEIERDASRWLICISEKYNSSELFNERRINNTRSLYKTMSFDDEGYMKGVNRNAYVIPRIIRYSNLSITRDAETNIINDLFAIKRIKRGENIEEVYNYLMDRVKKSNPTCDEEHVMQDAARWFVFLLENSYISLNVMFGPDREKYADITEKYYKEMKFDEHGNFINQVIPELEEDKNILHARREYMGIIDSFFNARGDFYLIGENMIPKQELQERLFKEIAKCKNKRDVRNACIRIRKEYNYRRRKKDGPEK